MPGYSIDAGYAEAENTFGITERERETEKLGKEIERLERELKTLEQAEKERGRLERDAVARDHAEKEATAARALAEKEEKERQESNRQEGSKMNFAFSQRLYDTIIAIDDFVASFQYKLRQNDKAKRRCDEKFESKKKSIDDDIRRSIDAIDKDVESFRDREIDRIDEEISKKTREINYKIDKADKAYTRACLH